MHKAKPRAAAWVVFVLVCVLHLVGCSSNNTGSTITGGGGGGSGTGGGGGGGTGGTMGSVNWPEDDESVQGFVMHTQQVPADTCMVNPNGGFTIYQQTTFVAESWSQYTATFVAVDQTNASLCQGGQAFQGVVLSGQSKFGIQTITLSPGSYFLAAQNTSNSVNGAGVEMDITGGPPGTSYVGTLFKSVAINLNPGGWQTIPFNIPSNTYAWLDGGNSGGLAIMMTPSQAQSFQATYSSGYNGGSYSYIEDVNNNATFCDLNGGTPADAPEDCDLTSHLPAGSYVLVFVNNTNAPQGYSAWGALYQ